MKRVCLAKNLNLSFWDILGDSHVRICWVGVVNLVNIGYFSLLNILSAVYMVGSKQSIGFLKFCAFYELLSLDEEYNETGDIFHILVQWKGLDNIKIM
jgi:hypothetical protein